MLGRAFPLCHRRLRGLGATHVIDILEDGIKADMGQMGIARPTEVRGRLA